MMEKMKMETTNGAADNIERLGTLFPEIITEAMNPETKKIEKSVDFDMLRQILSSNVVDGNSERYNFTWPGKKEAIVEANRPIRKTLRPCLEESKNWNDTKNIYIEGDNLDALKLIQESYLNAIKMIYIDPPYNTGNDFIYNDNYKSDSEEYAESTGIIDEYGNHMFKNTETNGRFHSDWCSMIYPRLKVARSILSEDGVIFISIDDNEIENLKKICNEIFGNSNFVAIINWKGRGGRQDSKYYAAVHEYILVYAKNITNFHAGEEVKSGDVYPKYDEEKKRHYKTQLLRKWGSNSRREDRPNLFYPIIAPDGSDVYPMLSSERGSAHKLETDGCWRHGVSTMKKNIEEGRVEFVKQSDGSWIAYEKIFAPLEGEESTKKYTTWIDDTNDGAKVVKNLFNSAIFDYPKTPALICKFLKMANVESGDVILDFFSGSATTAHAVMQLNAEDGGHRKFIMVQLPEVCANDSEAAKAGYKNICEIGKERIRRASKQIESKLDSNNIDTGFRVFKIDDSNMKDVFFAPSEYQQKSIDGMIDNIKEDRNDSDLLFGIMAEWGLELSLPIKTIPVDSKIVYSVDSNSLIACFERQISEQTIRNIAKMKPTFAVFRDSSFANSQNKINLEEIFKSESPETVIKVI